MHRNSILMFEKFAKPYFEGKKSVLEIGPDEYPSSYRRMLELKPDVVWDTLEIDSERGNDRDRPGHIISTDGYNYPIADNTYDVIFSAQVLEHVPNLQKWFLEKKRILKKGGLIISLSPNSWPYHLAPKDCWRIFPDGFSALAENVDMELVFSEFHSLELFDPILSKYQRNLIFPGVSYDLNWSNKQIRRKILLNRIGNRIPFLKFLQSYITVSYDCFTVFKKK